MKACKKISLALAIILIPPLSFANSYNSYHSGDYSNDDEFESLYAGIGLGNINIANKCSDYALNCDEEGLFYGAYAGIRPSKFWSVEVGFKSTTDFYFETYYPYEAHLSLISASLLFYLPLSPQFEFFGGFGGAISTVDTHDDYGYDHHIDSGVSNGFTAGLQINPSKNFTIRLMAEQWRNIDGNPAYDGDLDFNFFSVNAQFNFR